MRIPVRPFFAATSVMLLYMAFVFAGTGIKELQEGAYLPTTLVPGGPRSDFFGVFPTVETLAVQGAILAALTVALVWTFVYRPRRIRAAVAREESEPAEIQGDEPESSSRRTTQPRRRPAAV